MRGFTFLEMLVALAVFSFGLLGVMQLQFLVQRQVYDGIYSSVAFYEAYNFAAFGVMFGDSGGFFDEWDARLGVVLPEGYGVIDFDQVVVYWRGSLVSDSLFCEGGLVCVRLYRGI